MNFKMKAAVAAVALAASMSANAAMNQSGAGDSSLILTLLDSTAGVSATFDLGFTKSTFNQLANNSWDITAGNYSAAWSAFSTAVAGNFGNTQYAVFAGDSIGGVVAGDRSLFTTAAAAWASPSAVTNTQLATLLGNFDNSYIFTNNNLGNHASVADGANVATATGNVAAYAGQSAAYGTAGLIGGVGADANALIGTNLNVWNISNSSASALGKVTVAKLANGLGANGLAFNPYFNLSSTGALTYTAAVAAVPEADTWAMMLAGLGLMGFIARRRTAA